MGQKLELSRARNLFIDTPETRLTALMQIVTTEMEPYAEIPYNRLNINNVYDFVWMIRAYPIVDITNRLG